MIGFLAAAMVPWVLCFALWRAPATPNRILTPTATVFAVPVLALVLATSVCASTAAVAAVLLAQNQSWLRVAGGALLVLLGWRVFLAVRHLARVWSSARAAAAFAGMRSAISNVVVVDDDLPDAFASPASGGAVMVTSGLIDALDAVHVAAVVSHERAHLRYRHHFWIQSTELSAEINPLLRQLVTTVRRAAERQADEFAARKNRQAVLEAIARVALLHTSHREKVAAHRPAGSGGDIVERVRALAGPVPLPQRRSVVILVGTLILVLTVVSVGLFDVVQDVVAPEAGETSTSIFR